MTSADSAVNAVCAPAGAAAGRLAVLAGRDFRWFFTGYTTSLLGTGMSSVAVTFAVLGSGGGAAEVGYVMAAGVVPQVLLMLSGGVFADRLGRRPVMLAADALRCAAQAGLAAAVLAGRPGAWVFIAAAAAVGTGDAFFRPALSGLTVDITPPGARADANALLGTATAASRVAGPALAGITVALAGPGAVIALDAASYAVSVAALARLRPLPGPAAGRGPVRQDLRAGWAEFRSRPWLVATTVQFTLFNLFAWGPFLCLGPVAAARYLGGARGWGAVMSCYGAGAVLGGLAALGRRPGRPVAAATAASFGYALPCALLAAHAAVAAVAAGALAAGLGSGLSGAFDASALQQQVPARALGRVSALQTTAAFAFGPLAFAAAGPVAAAVGIGPVLGFGAAWSALSTAVVLSLPAVRAVTWRPPGPAAGNW